MTGREKRESGQRARLAGVILLCNFLLCTALVLCGCRDFQKELNSSIEAGNLEGVKSIIDPNPGLVSANSDGRGGNTLFVATASGKEDIVLYLISKGADVNGRNIEGLRPLHIAALKSKTRIAGVLLANGATVSIQDNQGKTPLHCAVSTDYRDMIDLLIAKGADTRALDTGGRSPLCYSRSIIAASILITAGADPKARDYNGETPSQWVAKQGYPDVARFLAIHERKGK